jgi:hypothetical protein
MFYLEIKSTLVILWSVFILLKINNAMNNIYQLVLISCTILSLSSWPLTPLTTIPKSEKFRFPKRVWSQGSRIRDCVPVIYFYVIQLTMSLNVPWCSIKFLLYMSMWEFLSTYLWVYQICLYFERNSPRQRGRTSRGWKDNIKIGLREIKLVSCNEIFVTIRNK